MATKQVASPAEMPRIIVFPSPFRYPTRSLLMRRKSPKANIVEKAGGVDYFLPWYRRPGSLPAAIQQLGAGIVTAAIGFGTPLALMNFLGDKIDFSHPFVRVWVGFWYVAATFFLLLFTGMGLHAAVKGGRITISLNGTRLKVLDQTGGSISTKTINLEKIEEVTVEFRYPKDRAIDIAMIRLDGPTASPVGIADGYPYKTLVPIAEDLQRRLTTLPKLD